MAKNYIINRTSLKSGMVAYGISRNELCGYLGITRQSLGNKFKGKNGFTENEISVLYSLFGTDIFLPEFATRNEARKGGK